MTGQRGANHAAGATVRRHGGRMEATSSRRMRVWRSARAGGIRHNRPSLVGRAHEQVRVSRNGRRAVLDTISTPPNTPLATSCRRAVAVCGVLIETMTRQHRGSLRCRSRSRVRRITPEWCVGVGRWCLDEGKPRRAKGAEPWDTAASAPYFDSEQGLEVGRPRRAGNGEMAGHGGNTGARWIGGVALWRVEHRRGARGPRRRQTMAHRVKPGEPQDRLPDATSRESHGGGSRRGGEEPHGRNGIESLGSARPIRAHEARGSGHRVMMSMEGWLPFGGKCTPIVASERCIRPRGCGSGAVRASGESRSHAGEGLLSQAYATSCSVAVGEGQRADHLVSASDGATKRCPRYHTDLPTRMMLALPESMHRTWS